MYAQFSKRIRSRFVRTQVKSNTVISWSNSISGTDSTLIYTHTSPSHTHTHTSYTHTTPQNSIRHNLSIRKNMFMKVYQYPPRRGNGSYWTLLSDGEDELKRAIPLFSTLLPPVIDQSCVYNRTPSTHVVKSRGQFVPVLPSAVNPSGQPYFAVGTVPTSKAGMTISKRKHGSLNKYMVPRHLLDHSYAKQPPQEEEEEEENQAVDSDSSDHESTFDAPATPKRKRLSGISVHRPLHEKSSPHAASGAKQDGKVLSLSPSTKQQDNSLNLLDSSLLTPVKNLMPDIEIDSLSLSPLYNFVTPRRGNTPMNFPSPFTPFKQATFTGVDSGIFSPLRTENLKFSTPVRNLSPLTDLLPPNTFSTPQDIFTSFKILDTSSGFGGTPFRPGSLQFLGLPGLTPPSASNRSQK